MLAIAATIETIVATTAGGTDCLSVIPRLGIVKNDTSAANRTVP